MRRVRYLLQQKLDVEKKSIRQVARESGLDYSSLRIYLESDRVQIRAENLELLARYLSCPMHRLLDEVTEEGVSATVQRRLSDLALTLSDAKASALLALLQNEQDKS